MPFFCKVRGASDAMYESKIEPWATWVSKEQGKALAPFYDPLAFAIEESHKRWIDVHAWITPYRAKIVDMYTLADGNIANRLKQHAFNYDGLIGIDPGAKAVRDWVVNVVCDIVSRYDVQGIVLDDYFYPYPKPGKVFPDEALYQEYLKCCGEIEKGD
jgi:uncharacterized lipoprotein YddW (UPF0748 family)